MKQKRTIYYVLATLMLLASCKTEDETTLTLYGDAAITSFTLGTLNRYVAGEKITYAGSAYPMQIDAVGKTIENVDSLLVLGWTESDWLQWRKEFNPTLMVVEK